LLAIIIGAGKVGFEIAQTLSNEGHDVIVIDKSIENLAEVAHKLDVLTISGNGASPFILEKARVDQADLLIAVTEIDEVNMIACMTAKQYGVKTCVARIRNTEYTSNNPHALGMEKLGIDLVIQPEYLTVNEIVSLLRSPMATEIEHFCGNQISLVGLEINPQAKIVGSKLEELKQTDLLVVAIARNGKITIPRGSDTIESLDKVYVVVPNDRLHQVRVVFGKPDLRVKSVAVLGASRIGQELAERLARPQGLGMRVVLIEKNRARAEEAAAALPKVLVIEGDGTKLDILIDERINEVDSYVAVSGEDHTNLLGTMLAKQLGIGQVITEISREDYVPLANKAGADAVVVPRLITASSVLRLVRRSNIVSMMILQEGKAEALEITAADGSKIVNKPLREVEFPQGAIVGAVLHQNKAFIATGNTVIRPNDRVIVFAIPEVFKRVECLFTSERPEE
jgi:trk system potassium uptake protein TrkA